MPIVELPGGKTAVLYSRDEITQRVAIKITNAFMKAGSLASKLETMGLVPDDPSTWGVMSDLTDKEQEELNAYQGLLITGFLKSWDLPDAIPTDETVLDLPRVLFEKLAEVCQQEFNNAPDFSPDGVTDPKADTGQLPA